MKYLKFKRSVKIYALIDPGEQEMTMIRSRVFRRLDLNPLLGGEGYKTPYIM